MPSERRAAVEMLVKPHVWRGEKRSLAPIDSDDLLSVALSKWLGSRLIRPHERVPVSLEHEEVSARAMVVSLLIGSRFPLGDVGGKRALSHLEHDEERAFAPRLG